MVIHLIVIIVHTVALTQLGAGTAADRLMTYFPAYIYIYTELAIEVVIIGKIIITNINSNKLLKLCFMDKQHNMSEIMHRLHFMVEFEKHIFQLITVNQQNTHA